MPSDKHNSIMAISTGLLSLVINVPLSQDMPFCQLQQLQCFRHGSTKAYLCAPLHSIPFYLKVYGWQFSISSVWDLVNAKLAGDFLILFLLRMLPKSTENKALWYTVIKRCTHYFDWYLGHTIWQSKHFVFAVMAGLIVDMLFMLFSCS